MRDRVAEHFGEDLLFLDPPEVFDKCIVGVGFRCASEPVVVYDAEKCIAAIMEGGLDRDDAVDHFNFNVSGAYVGPRTPMFLDTLPRDD